MQQRSGENVRQFKHRILDKQYNAMHSIFGDAIFNVPCNTFYKRYHQIRGTAKKKVFDKKNEIMNIFDRKTWSQLSPKKMFVFNH